jgi:hypothetical protein
MRKNLKFTLKELTKNKLKMHPFIIFIVILLLVNIIMSIFDAKK